MRTCDVVCACLTQVSLDFHGGVEDSQHLNPLLIGNEVGYAVVPVEDLTHFTISNRLVPLTDPHVLPQDLNFLINPAHNLLC